MLHETKWHVNVQLKDINSEEIIGTEGGSRTHMGLLPEVFETSASAIPPLRHMFDYIKILAVIE